MNKKRSILNDSTEKQFCGYCPEDKCLLDCEICNPKFGKGCKCDC